MMHISWGKTNGYDRMGPGNEMTPVELKKDISDGHGRENIFCIQKEKKQVDWSFVNV